MDNFIPVFEVGIVNDNPAVKVVGDFSVCPTTLAAFVVTLFETTMKSVDECDQIDYEKYFNKSFKVLMKERHNYDVTYKYLKQSEDDEY
jgi:hypothetical protein